jgi:hypothetical protein
MRPAVNRRPDKALVRSQPTEQNTLLWPVDVVVAYRIVYPRAGVQFPYGSPIMLMLPSGKAAVCLTVKAGSSPVMGAN